MRTFITVNVFPIMIGLCIVRSTVINNCRAAKLKFADPIDWPLYLDKHCDEQPDAYAVSSGSGVIKLLCGVYEAYGRSGGSTRYEMVLSNGSTFKLMRELIDGTCHWVIARSYRALYASTCYKEYPLQPPRTGWFSVESKARVDLTVSLYKIDRRPLLTRRLDVPIPSHDDPNTMLTSDHAISNTQDLEDRRLLRRMLHPALGPTLGALLRRRYTSEDDRPFDAITIDGLFNGTLLEKALGFMNVSVFGGGGAYCVCVCSGCSFVCCGTHVMVIQVPLTRWVGPETAAYCCKDKYRLSFQHWRTE